MLTIQLEFHDDSFFEFRDYLKENTWFGAKERVEQMEPREIEKLLQYLDEIDMTLTDIQLNDFIWFKWDEIKEQL